MNLRRSLWLLARITLPVVGFSLACLGAFLVSLRSTSSSSASAFMEIFAYVCIICGLLVLMVGVSWTICLGMRSKVYQQHRGRQPEHTIHVHTVDRPEFYPPAYEESLERNSVDAQVVVATENELHYSTAPPIYTRRSSEVPNDDFSSEEPPSYKEAMLQDESSSRAQMNGPEVDGMLASVPLDGR
ncbi:transmembrane protein 252-like [Megalops cyprinoides]|uniref:transmembrane protein 252-like n=1 Tax=Megalops cyprinoides TaxID=118141 RepID=UPI00186524AA|nr:transmembrane protein 252-like [Megalops cyprinoides]